MTKASYKILFLCSILVFGISLFFWSRKTPHILITPAQPLLAEQIEILISNLTPKEQVTIVANSSEWESHATFLADSNGVVNLAKQAPLLGSYSGIDPMGLFWSMTQTNKNTTTIDPTLQSLLNSHDIVLTVFPESKLRVQKTIHRIALSPDVERKVIRQEGIIGTLFYSPNRGKRPAIVTIPGAGGGIPEDVSGLLASHGYTVLALAYFGMPGLPEKSYSMIPLEYFENAIHWLKRQPQVKGNKIALMGQSRGAELVLLLASLFPQDIGAGVAYSPTHLMYGSWTYKNKPIPQMHLANDQETFDAAKEGNIILHKGTLEDPWQTTQIHLYSMKKFSSLMEAATIPVEKIRCPILILSGDDDKVWPSSIAGNSIIERLNAHGSTIKRKHVIYPKAGHNLFTLPYEPSIDMPYQFAGAWHLAGGTSEGNTRAQIQAWQETLKFLKETLEK